MALEGGSVTGIDNTTLVVTGTGLAKAVAEGYIAMMQAFMPQYFALDPGKGLGRAIRKGTADWAKNYGTWLGPAIVDYIVANAEVVTTITPTDAGLQRDPASSDPTLAPAADKTLQGVIT
jgi:hypothetical protein